MSIYATLWSIQIQDPASPWTEPKWVKVTAQAVPPHIGSPTPGCGYEEGDPYGEFLPPPMKTNEDGEAEYNRAVVFVREGTQKGTARSHQEYVDPLLVLTGEEYAKMPFQTLLDKLEEAIQSGPRVVMEYLDSAGHTHIFRENDEGSSPISDEASSSLPFHKLWIEQCEAAKGIEGEFGTEKALDYLIGEKFLNFLEAAETDVEFRAEIPAFVAEIKTIFGRWQLAQYVETALQTEPFDSTVHEGEDPEEIETLAQDDIRRSTRDLLLLERAREWLLDNGDVP